MSPAKQLLIDKLSGDLNEALDAIPVDDLLAKAPAALKLVVKPDTVKLGIDMVKVTLDSPNFKSKVSDYLDYFAIWFKELSSEITPKALSADAGAVHNKEDEIYE